MRAGGSFRILLVEDNPDHAELILRQVHRASKLRPEHVTSLSAGLQALADGPWDAVLLDLQLPDSRGLETLERMLAAAAQAPVIVLTSLGDDELATKALQQGAQDYLAKDVFTSELFSRAVRYAIERKRNEERLKASLGALAERAAELERLNRKLQEQNTDLDNFNHMISHDLREPVRHLLLFSQRLQRSAGRDLSEKAGRDLQLIFAAAQRMESSIGGIQLLSQAGRCDIDRVRVALGDCLHSALADLEQPIAGREAVITSDTLPEVVADPALLPLLLRNLISNAIKYCKAKPSVRITAGRDGGQWVFGVRDNGIGVDPCYAEHVFVPFRRLHAREEYGGGSGLGLAICRKIVERHGGRIWVEPNVPTGACFRFTLSPEAAGDSEPVTADSSPVLV
jgi:signal transduction histidine kinase